jgi:AraC-like DNA-binding protein
MEQILSHSQAANILICLILALHLFFVKARIKLSAHLLGINYLLYGCQSFLLIMLISGIDSTFASVLRPSIAMMLGPVLYLYFLSVKRKEAKFKLVDYVHFLPSVLLFLAISERSPVLFLIDYIIISSFSIYLILMILPMRGGADIFKHLGTDAKLAHRWLCVLAIMMAISIVIETAVFFEIKAGKTPNKSIALFAGTSLFLVMNAIVAFAALRRSELFEWMYEFGLQNIVSKLDKQPLLSEHKETYDRWQALVEAEELYKNEFGITLSQAARKLQIPARQLSNAINQHYGKSFSQYLNDQRVNEAKRLIKQHPEFSMLDVMYASGFSSKSNFNKEFQRVLGIAPTQYRISINEP